MNTHAEKIIDRLGGTASVSRLFDVRMPSVSNWKKDGIPRARMMYLEAVLPEAVNGIDTRAATRKPCLIVPAHPHSTPKPTPQEAAHA